MTLENKFERLVVALERIADAMMPDQMGGDPRTVTPEFKTEFVPQQPVTVDAEFTVVPPADAEFTVVPPADAAPAVEKPKRTRRSKEQVAADEAAKAAADSTMTQASVAEAAAEIKPSDAIAAPCRPVSIEDIRAVLVPLSTKLGTKEAVLEIIQTVGGSLPLASVPVERFPALLDELTKRLAA